MKYIFIIGRKDMNSDVSLLTNQIEAMKPVFEERGDTCETYWMKGIGDGTRKVRIYSDLHPNEKVCFVACGGDRTIGEVASGLVGFQNKTMAVFKLGDTGNDFVKSFPGKDFQDLKALLKGSVKEVDVLKINDSYSLNVCDFGFDSVAGSVANEMLESGRKKAYEWGIFIAFLTARFNRIKVVTDGEKLGRHHMLLCAVCNGQYLGNGFNCAPRAVMDDGLMDVCFIKPLSLFGFFRLLPIYRKGEHLDHPKFKNKIIYRQVQHVDVSSGKMMELCIDGEMLPGTKFSIDILPKAVKLLLPE